VKGLRKLYGSDGNGEKRKTQKMKTQKMKLLDFLYLHSIAKPLPPQV